jgi:hypothetical protein
MFDECSVNHYFYIPIIKAPTSEFILGRIVSSEGIYLDAWGPDATCADPTVGLPAKRNLGSTFPLSAD